ncbi:hypothetical protein [Dermatobacter hominis]|uniref:hypothetical protein n=1 Tax=Dermatobacter hominis TaxID=2884263 RepID=UPI001D104314|nr:hypothetical protein [Dermatobacter hominis]UDY34300.1 hypothetical protein LH044_13240 [Dermatobacter hominis]
MLQSEIDEIVSDELTSGGHRPGVLVSGDGPRFTAQVGEWVEPKDLAGAAQRIAERLHQIDPQVQVLLSISTPWYIHDGRIEPVD